MRCGFRQMAAPPLRRYALAIGLLLPCFASAAFLGGIARAADSLYDVAKISVDITAEDAVAARDMGMAEAQARAVKTVLQRLLPVGVDADLPGLTKEDIEGLVNGVSIRKEQNSTTRYIANLDVSVNEQAIKQLLQDYSLPYSEERAQPTSILPLMIAGGAVAGEGAEGWRQAWDDLDLSHSITPATILRPRPGLGLDAVNAVLAGDAEALAKMQDEYGSPLVIAVGEIAGGAFITRLAGADGVGQIAFERSDPVGGDPNVTAREAAAIALGIIENRWKTTGTGGAPGAEANNQPGAGGAPDAGREGPKGEIPRNIVAQVEFSGLKEWQEIRGRLTNVAGIQGLEVNSLSARAASITFDYAGPLGRLQQELDQNGFVFDDSEGTFVLRSR
jgi:Uncharacterized protein conserved in bacteria (DUF2066)